MRLDVPNGRLCFFPSFQVLQRDISIQNEICLSSKLTVLAKSRWISASLIAMSRKSDTFCRWNRSKSACKVADAYFRSCADACSESSSYNRKITSVSFSHFLSAAFNSPAQYYPAFVRYSLGV